MNNHTNHVQLIGHLGQDPEIKEVGNGTALVKLSIATNESYKDKNGEFQTKTQWHNLVAWGKLGERMASRVSKGNQILVTGRLENQSWEDKDGIKKYATNIRIDNFINFDKKKVTDPLAV
ncbi:UNVERIFIED_CONTAM: hypothetical protein GTU68_003301 [Idotea baltica]|nr:hypothetical protein [Idotea baltica]